MKKFFQVGLVLVAVSLVSTGCVMYPLYPGSRGVILYSQNSATAFVPGPGPVFRPEIRGWNNDRPRDNGYYHGGGRNNSPVYVTPAPSARSITRLLPR